MPAAAREPDLRVLLNALPAMVGYWDRDLRNHLANDVYVEYFGLTPGEMLGMHMSEVLGAELFELNRPHVEAALAGEPQLFDRTIVDRDGVARHTQASYVPDVADGEVRGFFVLVTDVTARRVAEQALAATEARFRLAFTDSPVGMGLVDADGRLFQVNAALCGILGRSEDDLRGRPFAELLAPEEQEQERERIARLLAGAPAAVAGEASTERRMLRGDGSPVWVILSLARARGEEAAGTLGIVHVQDISGRKRAEEALAAGRAQLAEAERVAQMGSWEWDVRGDRVSWSDGLFDIYGYAPEELDPRYEGSWQRVYPDDRERVRATLERALAERAPFELEYRGIRADGRVRTLRSRGEVVVDDEGEPVRLVGIVQDITEARLAQEALQNASADLGRRAIELQRLALQQAAPQSPADHPPLNPRQLEILQLVAQGLTNAQIGARLYLTEATVKWHMKEILRKTACANRAEAVARVLGSGQ